MDKNIKLSEKIINVLEDNDISLCGDIELYDEEYSVGLETYSPEGEDVIISFYYDGTEENFVKQFNEYANDFDVDEHVELYVGNRGKHGIPNSISTLLKDAEWIKDTLTNVGTKLNELDFELDKECER